MAGLIFEVKYHPKVLEHDLEIIDTKSQRIIRRAIESKLQTGPEIFSEALRQNLKGLRKMRVGKYRVVFYIEKNFICILIIAHRSVVYKLSKRRTIF